MEYLALAAVVLSLGAVVVAIVAMAHVFGTQKDMSQLRFKLRRILGDDGL